MYRLVPSDREGFVNFTIDFEDLAGIAAVTVQATTDSSFVYYDPTAPHFTNVTLVSSNQNRSTARVGDTVTLYLTSSELLLTTPNVTIMGHTLTAFPPYWHSTSLITAPETFAQTDGLSYYFQYTLTESDQEGFVYFLVDFLDLAGNVQSANFTSPTETDRIQIGYAFLRKTELFNYSFVFFDKTVPKLLGISILSKNANSSTARVGDRVILMFNVSDPMLYNPIVTIAGHPVPSTRLDINLYAGTLVMQSVDVDGFVNFTINYADLSGNPGAEGNHTLDTSYVIFDKTLPTLPSVLLMSSNSNVSMARVGDRVNVSIGTSEPLLFNPVVTIAGHVVTSFYITQGYYGAEYVMHDYDDEGFIQIAINATDLVGNQGLTVSQTTERSNYIIFDQTRPVIDNVTIFSNNPNQTLAMLNTTVFLTFNTSEPLGPLPAVTISRREALVSYTGSGTYLASIVIRSTDKEGVIPFTIDCFDLVGNAGLQVRTTWNGTYVITDLTVPILKIVSIFSNNQNTSIARAGDVVFLSFTSSERLLPTHSVTLATHPVTSYYASGLNYRANYTMLSSDKQGVVPFTIDFTDLAGNVGTRITQTLPFSMVWFDSIAPTLTNVTVVSSNQNHSTARIGDVVTMYVESDELLLFAPTVYLHSHKVVAVPTGPMNWFYQWMMTANDVEGAIQFQIDFADMAGNNGTTVSHTTSLHSTPPSFVIFDRTLPRMINVSIWSNNSNNATLAKVGDMVTIFMETDEPLLQNPVVIIAGRTVTTQASSMSTFNASYVLREYDGEGYVNFTLNFLDLAGNQAITVTRVVNSSSFVIFDRTAPKLPFVTIYSNNHNSSMSKVGDTVTLRFAPDEVLYTLPLVTIASHSVESVYLGSSLYSASWNQNASDKEGPVPFTVNFVDLAGNLGQQVISPTDNSYVIFDLTLPKLVSVSIASNNPNKSMAKASEIITLTFVASEPLQAVPNVTVNGLVASCFYVSEAMYTATRTLFLGEREGFVNFTVDFADLVGNVGDTVNVTLDHTFVIYDTTLPTLPTVVIRSNNGNSTMAKVGDNVTVSVMASEPLLYNPNVTIAGRRVPSFYVAGWYNATVEMLSTDVEGVVQFSVAFVDLVGNVGVLVQSTTSYSSLVIFDRTPPTLVNVTLVSNNANQSTAKTNDIVMLYVTSSEPLIVPPNASMATHSVPAPTYTGSLDYFFQYKLTEGDEEGFIPFGVDFTDLVGNPGLLVNFTTVIRMVSNLTQGSGFLQLTVIESVLAYSFVWFDRTRPVLLNVTIFSNNPNRTLAKSGDVVFVAFNVSEPLLVTPTVTISGQSALCQQTNGPEYVATVLMTATDLERIIPFTIDFADLSGNPGFRVSQVTDLSYVIDDHTPPHMASVTLYSNNTHNTSTATVGDLVTLQMRPSEVLLHIPNVTISNRDTPCSYLGSGLYEATIIITPNDIEQSVPFFISFVDLAGNTANLSSKTTDLTYVICDHTPPVVYNVTIKSSNQNQSTAKVGDTVFLTFIASEPLLRPPNVSISGHFMDAWYINAGLYTSNWTLQSYDPEGFVQFSIDFLDLAGNVATQVTTPTSPTNFVVFDHTQPILPFVALHSNNHNGSIARVGDLITLAFNTSETLLQLPNVTIAGHTVPSFESFPGFYIAQYTMNESDTEGNVPFTIHFVDLSGNLGDPISQTTFPYSWVYFIKTAPILSNVTIISSNPNRTTAKVGDTITLFVTAGVPLLRPPTVTISGHSTPAFIVWIGGLSFYYEWTMIGTDNEGFVPFTIDFVDIAGNNGTRVTTTGPEHSFVVFDHTAPRMVNVSIVSSNSNSTLAKVDDTIIVTMLASEPLLLDPVVTIAGHLVSTVLYRSNLVYTATYVMQNFDDERFVNFTIDFIDLAGNHALTLAQVVNSSTYVIFDRTPPTLPFVTIFSNNGNSSTAKVGEVVTVRFTTSEPMLFPPIVTIATRVLTSVYVSSSLYTISTTMLSSDGEGFVPFLISYVDLAGNVGTNVSTTTIGTFVVFDRTAPSRVSVTMYSNNPNKSMALVGNTVTVDFVVSEPLLFNPTAQIATHFLGTTYRGGLSYRAVWTMNINDTEGYVPFALNFTDLAGNNATTVESTTDHTYVIFVSTLPTLSNVTLYSLNPNSTLAKTDDTVILSFTASSVLLEYPVVTISGHSVPSYFSGGLSWIAFYNMTNTDPEGLIRFTIDFIDLAGNSGIQVTRTNGTYVIFDRTPPKLTFLSITSSNSNIGLCTVENTITITFYSNELVVIPGVTIFESSAIVSPTQSNTRFTAVLTTTYAHPEGPIAFLVNYTDITGNPGVPRNQSSTTDGTALTFIYTPVLLSNIEPAFGWSAVNDPGTLVTQSLKLTSPLLLTRNLVAATINITALYNPLFDALVYPEQIGNVFLLSNTNQTIELRGSDSYANYQAALRSIAFRVTQSPGIGVRNITFVTVDTLNITSTSQWRLMTVIPYISLIETTPAVYFPNFPAIQVTANISVESCTPIVNGTVAIFSGYSAGDTLAISLGALSPVSPVASFTTSAKTDQIDLTAGTGQPLGFQAAFVNVTFYSNALVYDARVISFQVVSADGLTSAFAARTIAYSSPSAAAVVIPETTTLQYLMNSSVTAAPIVTITSNISVAYSTALQTATIQIVHNFAPLDVLSIDVSMITAEVIVVTYNSSTGTLSLATATKDSNKVPPAQWQAAFRTATFSTADVSNIPGTRQVQFVICDTVQNACSTPVWRYIQLVPQPALVFSGLPSSTVPFIIGYDPQPVVSGLALSGYFRLVQNASVILTPYLYDDMLNFTGNASSSFVNSFWDNTTGVLNFRGYTTVNKYIEALQQITYMTCFSAESQQPCPYSIYPTRVLSLWVTDEFHVRSNILSRPISVTPASIPSVTLLSPAYGGRAVANQIQIFLSFSEPVVPHIGSIILFDMSQNSVYATISIQDTSRVVFVSNNVTITVPPLLDGRAYRVTIAFDVIRSTCCKKAFPGLIQGVNEWLFSSGNASTPLIISRVPGSNEIDVVGSNITLTFSEFIRFPLVSNSVTINVTEILTPFDGFPVQSFKAQTSSSQLHISGQVLTIQLNTFLSRQFYVVTMSAGSVESLAGGAFPGVKFFEYNFTTPNAYLPPKLLTLTPTNLSVASATPPITLQFDVNVLVNQGGGNFVISNPSDLLVDVISAATYQQVNVSQSSSGRGSVVLLTPTTPFVQGKVYSVAIPPSIIYTFTNVYWSGFNAWRFTVSGDSFAKVVSTVPTNNDFSVSIGVNVITMTFSEVMTPTFWGTLVLYNMNDEITTYIPAVNVAMTNKIGTFSIDPVIFSHSYTISFEAGTFQTLALNNISAYSWTFKTVGKQIPTYTSLYPAPWSTGVPVSAKLNMSFTEVVNPGFGEITLFNQTDGSSQTWTTNDPAVLVGHKRLEVGHSSLASGASYYVTVSSSALVSFNFWFLPAVVPTREWYFVTAGAVSPFVVVNGFSPANNNFSVNVGNSLNVLTMILSENVYKLNGSIQLVDDSLDVVTQTIPVTVPAVTISGVNGYTANLITITLSRSLENGKRYHVLMDGNCFQSYAYLNFAGISGNNWTFGTTRPPIPTAILFPTPNSTNVSPGLSQLNLTFSENVFPGTGIIQVIRQHDYFTQTFNVTTLPYDRPNKTYTLNVSPLLGSRPYYVTVPGTAFFSYQGGYYPGLSFMYDWFFTASGIAEVNHTSVYPNGTAVTAGITTLSITFNQNVFKVYGYIRIFNRTDHTFVQYEVHDPQVTLKDNQVNISVTPLVAGASYYVNIDPTCFSSYAWVYYPGISDFLTWKMFVVGYKNPVITYVAPSNSSTTATVPAGPTIFNFTFSEAVYKGAGNITIWSDSDEVRFDIDVRDPAVVINVFNVTLPAFTLSPRKAYHVTICSTCFISFSDLYFLGYSGKYAWRFVTTGTPIPTLAGTVPSNGSVTVAAGTSQVTLLFSEQVTRGSGTIVVYDRSRGTSDTYSAATDSRLIIGFKNVTILTTSMRGGDNFYVSVTAGSFMSYAFMPFDGIAAPSSAIAPAVYFFTTLGTTVPVPVLYPTPNWQTAPIGLQWLFLQFDQYVLAGPSKDLNISIIDMTEIGVPTQYVPISTIESYIQFNRSQVNITLSSVLHFALQTGHAYAVLIPSGYFQSFAGVSYGGVVFGQWNFVVSSGTNVFPSFPAVLPSNGASGVSPSITNLSMAFSENIFLTKDPQGLVYVFDDLRYIAYPHNFSSLVVNANVATLVLNFPLQPLKSYSVYFYNNVLQNAAFLNFSGIGEGEWRFNTTGYTRASVDSNLLSTPPNASYVPTSLSNLTLVFSQNIQAGSGSVTVVQDTDGVTYTIPASAFYIAPQGYSYYSKAGLVNTTVNGNVATVFWKPYASTGLQAGKYYYVLIPSTAFTSRFRGDSVFGITDSSQYVFRTTGGVPLSVNVTFFPADNAVRVNSGRTQLFLDFRVPYQIYAGNGSITIDNLSDNQKQVIPARNSSVAISGSAVTLTINPLIGGKQYAVEISNGAFSSYKEVIVYEGTNSSSWNFFVYLNGSAGPCPWGMYGNGDNCWNCPAGKFSNQTVTGFEGTNPVTQCYPCPLGKFTATDGMTGCLDCLPGTYTNVTTTVTCPSCERGYAQGLFGQTTCAPCLPGMFASVQGLSTCISCDPGWYSQGGVVVNCTKCPVGTFQNYTNSSACNNCSTGYYQDTLGQTVCTACPVGWYLPTTGSSTCVICPIGKYNNNTAVSVCTDCEPGRYGEVTGLSVCASCAVGRFMNVTGSTVCFLCPTGFFQNVSESSACTACSPGFYSPVTGSQTCLECSSGTYTPWYNYSTCLKCSIGTYSVAGLHGRGISTCTDCAPGKYTNVTGTIFCVDCAPGTITPNNGTALCSACPIGQYQALSGQTGCTACNSGYLLLTGQTFCVSCPPGQYAVLPSVNATRYECRSCDPGYYTDKEGSTVCKPCPAGTQAVSSGTSTCSACFSGRYAANNGTVECSPCSVGKFSVADGSEIGPTTCGLCAPGKYTGVEAQQLCFDCEGGFFENRTGSSLCQQCAPGKYMPFTNATACLDCELGHYADRTQSLTCAACSGGYYANSTGYSACIACLQGSYQPDTGQTGCLLCPTGTFSNQIARVDCNICQRGQYAPINGSTFCTDCEIGKYADGAQSSTCKNCSRGQFVGSTGADKCTDCIAGTYAPDFGTTQCSSCGLGFQQPTPGQPNCIPCNNGTYSDQTATAICTPCAAGRYMNATGATLCFDCLAGKYQGSTGSAQCLVCPEGTYSSGSNALSCTPCAAGSRGPAVPEGLSACFLCDSGTYQPLSQKTGCLNCSSGTYAPSPGSVSCVECDAGKFSSLDGASICDTCVKGSYSLKKSNNCTLCEVGFYADLDGLGACKPCAVGTYANTTGFVSCDPCALGYAIGDTQATACAACDIGFYADTTGSISCKGCLTGKYQPDKGQSFCFDCEKGKFQSNTSSTVCQNCSIGSYARDPGAVDCLPCDLGFAIGVPGQAACINCVPGYYGPSKGLTACLSCDPGTFQDGFTAAVCKPCDPGSYTNASASAGCTQCQRGYFSVKQSFSLGATQCTPCTAGYIASSFGSAECTPCAAGTYIDVPAGSSCLSCQPGRFQDLTASDRCKQCPAGFYTNDLGRVQCLACAAGTFQFYPGQTECVNCAAGSFSPTVSTLANPSTACTPCAAGRYADLTGQALCKSCDSGKFQANPGSASCDNCAKGTAYTKVGDVGATACIPCKIGQYAVNQGSPSCASCPVGKYGPSTGLSSCTDCAPGYSNNVEGQGSCQPCPAGAYSVSQGTVDCISCDAGKFTAEAGQATCTECSLGSYAPSGARTCIPCDPGFYADNRGLAQCKTCQPGKISASSGAVQCAECPEGEYQDQSGQSSCNPCSPGLYTSAKGQIGCVSCDAGKYSGKPGSPICPSCPVGTVSQAGKSVCTNCTAGTYADTEGLASCRACARGTYMDHVGAVICTACPAGKYIGDEGAKICKDCDAGTYTADTGRVECIPCDAGKIAAGPGLVTCDPCAAGKFQPNKTQSVCVECSAGKFAPQTGLTVCIDCEPGTYTNNTGVSTCDLCAESTSQPTPGQISCLPCPVERYSLKGATTCNVCPANQYRAIEIQQCQPCPAYGATCADSLITATTDYYISRDANGIATAVACPTGFCADGGCGLNRKNASNNVLCGECEDGYSPSGSACVLCTGYNWSAIAMFTVAIWIGVLVLTYLSRPHPADTAYFQLITYFLQMGLLFLGPISQWSSWLLIFNLDLSNVMNSLQGSGSSSCIAPVDPYGVMLMNLASPVAMVFMLCIILIYTKLWYKDKWQSWNHVRTGMSIFLFIYVPVTNVVLQFLNCVPVGNASVVSSNPAINCSSATYQTYSIGVIAMLLFFVIGGPLGLGIFLVWSNRKGKLLDNDFNHRYGILYDRFKPEAYWWVVVTLLRRTVLVAMSAFIAVRGERFALVSFAQLLFVVMQVYFNPYLLQSENVMAFSSLTALLVLSIGLGSYAFPYSNAVQAFLTVTIVAPALAFIGFMAYDKVRQTFYPTEEEKKKLREWNRNLKRGKKAFQAARGDTIGAVKKSTTRKKKKKKDKKKKNDKLSRSDTISSQMSSREEESKTLSRLPSSLPSLSRQGSRLSRMASQSNLSRTGSRSRLSDTGSEGRPESSSSSDSPEEHKSSRSSGADRSVSSETGGVRAKLPKGNVIRSGSMTPNMELSLSETAPRLARSKTSQSSSGSTAQALRRPRRSKIRTSETSSGETDG